MAIVGAVNSAGANPAAKVMSLLAGMVAGAHSIEDVKRLRHASNERVFAEVRAPSTLGPVLAFTHGHVQQLNAVARQTLIQLAEHVPPLGEGQDQVVFVDVDSTPPAGLRPTPSRVRPWAG